MKRKISALVAVCSFIWILGVAGASDCNTMGFSSIVAQGTVAALLFTLSLKIGGFIQ